MEPKFPWLKFTADGLTSCTWGVGLSLSSATHQHPRHLCEVHMEGRAIKLYWEEGAQQAQAHHHSCIWFSKAQSLPACVCSVSWILFIWPPEPPDLKENRALLCSISLTQFPLYIFSMSLLQGHSAGDTLGQKVDAGQDTGQYLLWIPGERKMKEHMLPKAASLGVTFSRWPSITAPHFYIEKCRVLLKHQPMKFSDQLSSEYLSALYLFYINFFHYMFISFLFCKLSLLSSHWITTGSVLMNSFSPSVSRPLQISVQYWTSVCSFSHPSHWEVF
jgi:hypothetical protein